MSRKTKTLLLCLGICVLLAISSLGVWYLTKKDEPTSKGNVLGIAWYDEDGKEFTINTAEELRELAALSKHYNFKGQTIKLGADIVDNEGTATDWEYEVPEHIWEPIENFAGTFDGQGHTISGICGYGFVYNTMQGDSTKFCTTGLFNSTQTGCVIKDFRLVNSFFYSDFNEGVGSITNRGGGTFDSIYSNATILSYKQNTGGLIGLLDARGSHTVTNCWYDGEIRIEGNTACYIGGIVGQVKDTSGQNKIEHCLNTANLSSTVTGRGINMGGLVGIVQKSARVILKDCMNVGNVTNEYGVAVGSVIGNTVSKSAVNMSEVYTTVESFNKIIGVNKGTANGLPMGFDKNMLTGQSAYQWTNLDFDKYWAAVEDDTPVLKYFTDTELGLDGVEKCFDTSWYSQHQSEFVITNEKELYGFTYLSRTTDFSDKTIKLGADIVVNEGDASTWTKEAPQYNWISIGSDVYPFAGTFDGDMHSISGIYLETEGTYSGLFSMTTELATIKNLKLLNSCFKFDGASSGSISGRGRGTFDTIYSEAIVIGSKVNLGGLIGQVPGDGGIKMNNCWFNGSVTHTGIESSDRKSAGLVGVMYSNSVITNCLNTGTINANLNSQTITAPYAGGLVGQVAKDKTLTMSGCLNVGEVKVSSAATQTYGSLVGYVTGSISLTDSYVIKESCDKHTLRACLAGDAVVLNKKNMTGYQAYQRTLLDFDQYWAVVKNGTPILKSFATNVPSLKGVKRLYDIKWYNANKKTYVLDSKEDLYGFVLLSYNTNFEGKTIKLDTDVVFNGGNAADWAKNAPANEWIPISSNRVPFSGTFDGGMHSVSGIYLNTDEAYQGLFSTTSKEATIKNLKLTNSYFETSELSFGSIAGRGRGNFDTIYSDAIVVSCNGNLGGIVGQVPGDGGITMTNCWFNGSVTNTGNTKSERKTGGLVGVFYSDSVIDNCLNSGTIAATKYTIENKPGNKVVVPLAGGLVGHWGKTITATITNCLNVGEILVSEEASTGYGPIVGYRDGEITIKNTYATSDSCKSFSKSRINGMFSIVDVETISGVGAYQWTVLDFDKYWAAVTGTPILKAFAGEILNLAGIEKMIDFSWYEQAQGTAEDPYILWDMKDLFGFATLSKESNFAGKTIKLGGDIVVNKDMTNPQYDWIMIGSSNKSFEGTFDGQMHSISGLYLKTDERYSGLFAKTGANAIVQNLMLENSYFETTNNDCGSIVGQAQGTFSKVYSDAIVKSSKLNVGGLIGSVTANSSVDMDECWYAGTVSVTNSIKDERQIGGLIGYILNSKSDTPTSITNCLNSGTIDVTSEKNSEVAAGGLVGRAGSSGVLVISNSLNVGPVTKNDKTTKYYGSIIGYNPGEVTVTNTYATTESCKKTSGDSITSGRISQVMADSIKGYSGYQWTLLDFDNYWAVVKNPSDDTPILKTFASEVPDLASVKRMINFSWMEQAAGTAEDPYILKDAADLYGLAMLSVENNFEKKHIKLGDDIVVNQGDAKDWNTDAPAYGWIQIGSEDIPFEGTFDGQMHTISGIYLNTSSQYGGLFAVTGADANICNLKLKNSYFETSANNIGSIAGQAKGTFSKIYSDAIVKSSAVNVGGLIGRVTANSFVDMDECWYAGNVSVTNSKKAERQIGGLIGFILASNSSTPTSITNCLNSGTVDATSEKNDSVAAGGLVGRDNSGKVAISNSLNVGLVAQSDSTTEYYGPIIGRSKAESLSMPNTYATTESSRSTANSGFTSVPFESVAESTVIGWDAATTLTNLGDKWAKADYNTPVLIVFENESDGRIDTSWFDVASYDSTSEYTLYDEEDLYGFTWISRDYDFRGKTVRLGADIVVNEGTASADWAIKSNYRQWWPIGLEKANTLNSFQGTFDGADPQTGNIYTISGLYLNTSSQYGGLFAATEADATICNLKLKNSYFKTSANNIGSIAGQAKGTFSQVYSNATVKSSAVNVGGLIGRVATNSFVDMDECWYAGNVSVTNSKKAERQIGGLIGFVLASSSSTSITNCLNSGTIDATSEKNSTVAAGGLVGRDNAGNVAISNSLNVGKVKQSGDTTKYYGPIIGRSKTASLSMPNTYATTESSSSVDVSNLDPVPFTTVAESTVIGWDAATILTNLGDLWTKVDSKTPVLTVFINESVER